MRNPRADHRTSSSTHSSRRKAVSVRGSVSSSSRTSVRADGRDTTSLPPHRPSRTNHHTSSRPVFTSRLEKKTSTTYRKNDSSAPRRTPSRYNSNSRNSNSATSSSYPAHHSSSHSDGPSSSSSASQLSRTSWEPLASWYNGWVGKDGSDHHQKLAIPALLELAKFQEGESILDIGCGQGVLAPHVHQAGGHYTGVDASPSLINIAKKSHGDDGQFLVGDSRKLGRALGSSSGSTSSNLFDVAVFLLSIQDMDPLEEVIAQAAQALKPVSRICILMTHPCFRIPRQSGWGWDEGRKLFYRRIDRYLTPLSVPLKAYSGQKSGVSISFHRPVSAYVNLLGQHGYGVTAMSEIPTYKRENTTSDESKAMNRAHEEIPLFLGLTAQRK